MTSVRALFNTYDALLSAQMRCPSYPQDLSDKINREAERVWRSRVPPRHAPKTPNAHSVARPDPRYPSSASLPAADPKARRKRTMIRPVQPLNLEGSPIQCSTSPSPASRLPANRTLRHHLTVKEGGRLGSDQLGSSSGPSSPRTDSRMYASDSSGSEDDVVAARASAKGKGRAKSSDRLSKSTSSQQGRQKAGEAESEDEDAQQRELKDHFIKRVHNVVSVWIRTTALQKKEAAVLRRRLEQEKAREKAREDSRQPPGEGSSGAATSRDDPARHPDSPSGRRRSDVKGEDGIVRSGSPIGRRAFSGSDLVPSDPTSDFAPTRIRQSRASDPQPAGRDELVDEGSDDDLDAEAAFDPAMGMGVEEDDIDYSDDLLPLDEGHLRDRSFSRRSHSRAGSARSTPKLIDDYDYEPSRPNIGRRTGSTDSLPDTNAGLGLGPIDGGYEHASSTSFQASRHLHHRLRPHHTPSHHSRTPVSGASSPLASAGYGSPHRARARRIWHTSISPTMRSSSHSSESDSERGSDDESDAVDEELMEIQRSLWRPYLVQLASPFVLVSGNKRVEAGVYFGFEKLMSIIGESSRPASTESPCLRSHPTLTRRLYASITHPL